MDKDAKMFLGLVFAVIATIAIIAVIVTAMAGLAINVIMSICIGLTFIYGVFALAIWFLNL